MREHLFDFFVASIFPALSNHTSHYLMHSNVKYIIFGATLDLEQRLRTKPFAVVDGGLHIHSALEHHSKDPSLQHLRQLCASANSARPVESGTAAAYSATSSRDYCGLPIAKAAGLSPVHAASLQNTSAGVSRIRPGERNKVICRP